MSSRPLWITTVFLAIWLVSCSTDPMIDWDRLEQHTFVTGNLITHQRYCDNNDDDCINWQEIIVQQLRPLVGLAFDPEDDQFYGISKAEVTVSDSDSTYQFIDNGYGGYFWEGTEQFAVPGRTYLLEITLSDGHYIHSEIVAPKTFIDESVDTIWISPDSITVWHTEWASHPVIAEGPHYGYPLEYEVTEDSDLNIPLGEGNYEAIYTTDRLWYKIVRSGSHLWIYTATDSPTAFRQTFSPVPFTLTLWAEHETAQNLNYIKWDDEWPVENLEELSNVEGAYGIFTAENHRLEREYVVALKP